MAIAPTKQEQVVFDKVIEGFDDLLVIGKAATLYEPLNAEQQARALDKFWVTVPQISASFSGFDQTANFGDITELAVPVTIGYHQVVPIKMSAKEARLEMALERRAMAAKQKLASDVNLALFNTAALLGTNFVKRTGAATGYDDLAAADVALTRIGVPQDGRAAFMAPSVMNAMAGNLASRSEDSVRSKNAYENALIRHDVAGFEVFKNDQEILLALAGGGVTTVNGANQRTVPAPYTTAATGETENKDNRYTDLVITATTYANIKQGDAFTIAGVNSVHLVTKQDTGQLQTFRVVSKPAANTIRIYPAIIAGGATRAEVEYQNCSAVPANGAAITWLNTANAPLNPFFKKESLLLVPGSYAVDPDDGWNVALRAQTDLGIGISYVRQGEINDLSAKVRWELDFGTALINPQMAGALAFSQP